jgi:hypothetical protein
MELTPAERIKLNAAIVNSVKTGQPLSSNLQTLYDRAAQVKSVRQTQPRALLNPGFPTRNVTEVFVDPVTGKRDTYKHSGPASSLPTKDFEELYPKTVPIPRAVPRSQQNKNDIQEELVRTPFQREFDFTKDPGSDWVDQDRVSIQDRSQRFLQNYFGGDPGKVVNPATGRFYGDELKIHDAMHDFANVGNTLRGEELITIAEQAGASPLQSSNIGLENLTQQFLLSDRLSPAEITDEAMSDLRSTTRTRGPTLIQQRGAKRGSSLYRDANNIGSFLSPPISKEEYGTMINRGREFYDQVHNNFANYKRFQDPYDTSKAPTPQSDPAVRKDIEKAFFNNDYGSSRAVSQGIVGGYGKSNSIPFGNYMSLMNAPLVPTVNEGLWNESIKKQLTSLAPSVEAAIKTEQDVYNSPEQIALREAPKKWDARSRALMSLAGGDLYFDSLIDEYKEKGIDIVSPEFQRDSRVYNALQQEYSGRTTGDILEDTIGPRPKLDYDVLRDQQKLTSSFNALDWVGLGKTQDALQGGIDDTRNALTGGITGAGPTKEGRVYLNPANLGANNLSRDRETPLFQRSSSSILFSPSGRTPNDILLQAAAEAKQIEGYNKALPGIKQAIRTGANATTDITGAIPLFDPEFRQAVEKGDVRKAATQVAKEYATGVVAAPIVGAGTGFAQRLAPRAAAAVIPAAATALRIANPVAVVSQLGGSSKMTPRQEAYENQLRETKFRKAEAARKRGGRWKFPTPFGNLTIPEFGISEAGGLFFR